MKTDNPIIRTIVSPLLFKYINVFENLLERVMALIMVKKEPKTTILTFWSPWPIWFKPRNDSEIFNLQVTWLLMLNLVLLHQVWQSQASFKFLGFLLKKQLLWRNWLTSELLTSFNSKKVFSRCHAQSSQACYPSKNRFWSYIPQKNVHYSITLKVLNSQLRNFAIGKKLHFTGI